MKVATYREAQETFVPPREPLRKFANPDVVCQGWYCIGRSSDFRGVRRMSIGKIDLVFYRAHSGTIHAVERSCGHLGADLSKGRVIEKGLQCSFHRWCWSADGTCGTRRIRTYAVREKWGFVWVWAGE